MTEIPLKRCSRKDKCIHPNGPYLPATTEYFTRSSKNKDGLGFRCKVCSADYYRRNPEPAKARAREYHQEHAERISELAKMRYQRNKEQIKEKGVRYRAENAAKLKAYRERFRTEHRERYLERKRNSYFRNREGILERQAEWRKANPEIKRERGKRYYEQHKGELSEKAREYRRKNKDKIQQRQARWRRENRDKDRATKRRYKVRKINAPGYHDGNDIVLQYRSQKGLCWWCEKPVGDDYHVDHRIALNRGGSNWPNNLCISCPVCNMAKKDRMPYEWIGRLL